MVTVRCPDCADATGQAVTAFIVDGPGVCYQQVAVDESKPGDICHHCPRCGKLWCVRPVRAVA